MAGLISTGIAGFIASAKFTGKQIANKAGKLVPEVIEDFVSGFSGHGWKIWKTVAGFFRFEIDELVVRRTMTVFELLIQKIRAVKGAMAITQANGKIKSIELSEDEAFYLITLEENDMSIVEHDFIRCQEFSGGQRFYHVEVSAVSEGVIRVPVSEFAGSSIPNPGDEIVQFGNSSRDPKYAGRHSAIYMHADESGQPAIDVMFDIYSKNWTGCVKTRVGGDIPGTNGLKGFYCENGMIKGVNSTGHTVYCIYPDGSAMFGDGSAEFNTDKSGHIAGGAISWKRDADTGKYICTMKGVVLTWDNLSDDAKDNLKGEAAVMYELIPNAEIITMTDNGQFHPSFVQCQVKKTVGSASSFMTAEDISADGMQYGWVRDDSGFIHITPEESVTPNNDCFPIVFHLKRSDVYVCSKSIVTLKDGEDGVAGEPGVDGKVLYTWIRYADSSSGSGISNNPTGKLYIGFAYNKDTSVESNIASDYTWSLIKGVDGVPGAPGTDGKVTYTWIAYSDNADGSGMYQLPKDSTRYIGIAVNKDTAVESGSPSDYNWSKFRGDDAIVYELVPSTEIIVMNSAGRFTPDRVMCQVKKTIGAVSVFMTTEDIASDGLFFCWLRDDSGYMELAPGDGIAPNDDLFPIVFYLLMNGESICSKTVVTIKDGADGSDGNPGADANLLPWVEQWDNERVYIDSEGEYIISPKMFSGSSRRDESGKQWLTGIAMGRDCLTDPDGTKRTGVFAVVDNEVVFELDPMTKKYKFKGRIEADEGYIGGNIEIDGELISKVISATNITTSKITITDGASIGDFKVDGGGLTCEDTPALIGLKYADNSLDLGAGGVHIQKMNAGYAFRITGAVGWADMDVASIRITSENYEFIQRDGGQWNVPGVLWCGAYTCSDWNPVLTRSWGNGLGGVIPSISRSKSGCYTITHNLKHTDYYIHAIGSAQIRVDWLWWNTTCGFINVNSNSFTLQFKDDGGNEKDPSEFQVMIFGRNKSE